MAGPVSAASRRCVVHLASGDDFPLRECDSAPTDTESLATRCRLRDMALESRGRPAEVQLAQAAGPRPAVQCFPLMRSTQRTALRAVRAMRVRKSANGELVV